MANQANGNVLILVMGMTGSGKTSFINQASGSSLVVGRGLESCTSEIQLGNPFVLDGHTVTLIDSSGFDDTNRSEAEVLREVTGFLTESYEQGRLLAGVLYIHRITDKRVGGMAKRNFAVFRRLCGETTLKNAMIVTNMWTPNASEAIAAEEEDREKELASNDRFFKRALENGARMVRHHNTIQSAHSIIRHFLKNEPQPLLIQRELVDENKRLVDTDIGSYVNEELKKQSEHHAKEIEEINKQHKEQMDELALHNARLRETVLLTKEQGDAEKAALRELVLLLMKELKETKEALREEREKVRKLEQQMQSLMSSSKELRGKVEDTVKAVNEIMKDTNRQRKDTESMVEKLARERRSATLPAVPAQFQQREEEEKEAWCVVQ